MDRRAIAARIAARYESRVHWGYARTKLLTDPAFETVAGLLRGRTRPLVDAGCGIGLLEQYLRESGFEAPIVGSDIDDAKIDAARRAGATLPGIRFEVADARSAIRDGHDVILLDVVHYLLPADQERLLRTAADATRSGGMVILRQGIRDRSWRYRLTAAIDVAGRAIRWHRGAAVHFPTREQLLAPFDGFDVEVRSMWGGTPFNNYLFVLRAPA